MALSYGFYNSYNGDRKYNTEQISSMFDGIIQDGIFEEIGEKFAVIPGDGLQVIVKSGKAWFDRTWLVNDAWYPVNLPGADLSRSRIDAIVIETDHTQAVRKTSIKVVSGSPAAIPSKPTMVKTELINQHPLAYVTVGDNATQITSANIELRTGFDECPWITGVLRVTSIEDLFNTWAAQFQTFQNSKEQDYQAFLSQAQDTVNTWIVNKQNEFNAWWDIVKATLNTDTAASLQNQILSNDQDIAALQSADVTLQNNIDAKQNKIGVVGLLKGTGNGNIVQATLGTDYADPNTGWKYRIYYESGSFTAPADIVNPCHVMCFGGGGGGSSRTYGPAGGSGRFVEGDYVLTPNATYQVTIGGGGNAGSYTSTAGYTAGETGGTTKFGSLISASGGNGGGPYQLNASAYDETTGKGGDGGAGGGGGQIVDGAHHGGQGGRGYEFGGGGAGHMGDSMSSYFNASIAGGKGGIYGGGGGGACSSTTKAVFDSATPVSNTRASGGTYGGNGGMGNAEPTDGAEFNPSIWFQLLSSSINKLSKGGKNYYKKSTSSSSGNGYFGGGGGGYGGKGSDGNTSCGTGGGGGYGGDAAHCPYSFYSVSNGYFACGGGGYGTPLEIESGVLSAYGASGGNGFFSFGGGSVLYLPGNSNYIRYPNGYAASGGGGSHNSVSAGKGGDGVCVVFYRTRG